MKLYVDLDSGAVLVQAGFTREYTETNPLTLKRGDSTTLEIGFVRSLSGGVLELLDPSASITVGLKEQGKYEGDYLTSGTTLTQPATASDLYQIPLNLNTVELNTLLNNDGDDTNDIESILAMFEVSWNVGGVIASSQTSYVRVYHDVIQGNEGVPTSGTPAYPSATDVQQAVTDAANAYKTEAEVKTAYENNANTNAFTDSEQAKLASIDATHYLSPVQGTTNLSALTEASLTDKARVYVEDELSDYFYDETAGSGDVSPDDQTGGTGWWKKVAVDGETSASIKTKYESNANTNTFTDSEQSKLSGIESNATADQTDAEIKTAYENNSDTNAFTDAEQTKLSGVESGATADQTGAEIEALIDAELGSTDWKTGGSGSTDLSYTASTRELASSSGNNVTLPEATVSDAGLMASADKTKLDGVESGATADQSDLEIETAYNNQVAQASQAEMEAGTETGVRRVSPENVKQAIDANSSTTLGTSKFDTKKLWHDGRTVYGKVLQMTPAETETFLNTDGNTFAHGEDTDRLISYSGSFKSDTGEIYVIPFAGETGAAADDFTTYNINFNSTNLINQSFNNGTTPLVWSSNISDGLELYMEWVEPSASYTPASDTFESGENSTQMILSNSDVTVTSTNSPSYERAATFSFSANSGLYYVEFDYDLADSGTMVGVGNQNCDYTLSDFPGGDANSVGIWRGGGGDRYVLGVANGGSIKDPSGSGSEASVPTTGDREAIAIDTATGNIWFGVVSGSSVTWFRDASNNVSDPSAGTNPHLTLSGTSYRFMVGDGANGGVPSFSIVPAIQRVIW